MSEDFFELLKGLAVEKDCSATTEMEMEIEIAKETAIIQFQRRRAFSSKINKVDNSTLPTGAPVFTYCCHCGIPLEKLPEDYLFRPYSQCSQCSGLEREGWLDDAITAALNNV